MIISPHSSLIHLHSLNASCNYTIMYMSISINTLRRDAAPVTCIDTGFKWWVALCTGVQAVGGCHCTLGHILGHWGRGGGWVALRTKEEGHQAQQSRATVSSSYHGFLWSIPRLSDSLSVRLSVCL